MHSQSILRPAVENSNVVCHDTRFVKGRLAKTKEEGQKLLLDLITHPKRNIVPMVAVLCTTMGMTNQIAIAYFYAFAYPDGSHARHRF